MERPGSADRPRRGVDPDHRAGGARDRRPFALGGRSLTVHVGHAQAAAHDELGQAEGREERAEHLGRLLERRGVEHLAPDVRMHADQLDSGQQLQRGHGLGGRPRRHREAELGVFLPGAHELVGVRLHTRGHPHEHLGPGSCGRG